MKNTFATLLLCATLGSCSAPQEAQISLIPQESFEAQIDGKDVSLYTLVNEQGTTMQVTNFGARVVALWTQDRDGNWADIVLGYESLDRYVNNTGERFLGATIGRFGNRIADGKFSLNDKDYQLSTYNNGQCLHGGDKGFDMVVWSVDSLASDAIYFSYLSKDMEEGFPGNLDVKMTYRLTADNEFVVEHSATTDQATPVNLTHHSFFNLLGEGGASINNHIMKIAASKYTPVNASLIPLGELASVENTPFDFRTEKEIGKEIEIQDIQFENCLGYDHNFVLDRQTQSDIEFAASVYEPTLGRYMEVWTTEPGLQFYGGNFFDGETLGKSGKPYNYRSSLALETQHFPDSPNQPSYPSTILNPGEVYSHTCIYKFATK